MKKLRFAFILLAVIMAVCACSENNNIDQAEDEQQQTADEITFSGDDIALFYDTGMGELKPAVNLFMNESEIPYDEEGAADILNGCNIGFEEYNGVNYVNYIYLRGSALPVYTAKGIKTVGLDFYYTSSSESCSNEEDVISAYGINTDEEEVYYKPSKNSESTCIAVFYNIENDGSAERIKYPKGTDITDFNSLDANAVTSFEIRDGKVIGITMRSKILTQQ